MIDKLNDILLVEDEESHIELIRRSFNSEGNQANLTVATTLQQAQSLLLESSPDVVIVDLNLPDGKGTELLINGRRKDASYPIVVMTSYGDEQEAVEAIKAGALDYVVKSEITFEAMPRIIQRVLREWGHIVERKRVEENLKFLAMHNPLTNLPNRTLFRDRLDYALETSKRNNDEQLAVLFLDLDGFKSINDAFGHNSGDFLLKVFAKRLRNCLREGDTVAHMGGDEFSILLEAITLPDDVISVAEKILEAIAEPFVMNESEIYITASIGVSVFPENCDTPEELLRNADIAMYHAKSRGRNKYVFYSDEMADKSLERLALINQLSNSLENNELELYYQPQVNLVSGKIIGVEGLLRWNHPERGLIYPNDFIPHAESSGLIIPIGEWVIKAACVQAAGWQESLDIPMQVAVNVSKNQLLFHDLVSTVRKTLLETGLPPQQLEIEITENSFFQNDAETIKILEGLNALGVRLALDDFGTGYSSLKYLAQLPLDTIKIDKTFSQNVLTDPSAAVVVSGMIAMTNSLGKSLIVEGVETEEQLNFFLDLGCEQFQGWYYSPPIPETNLLELLKNPKSRG